MQRRPGTPRLNGNYARPPLKAARTILTAHNQVKPSKDCVVFAYPIDLTEDNHVLASAAHSVPPHRSRSCRGRPVPIGPGHGPGINARGRIVELCACACAVRTV